MKALAAAFLVLGAGGNADAATVRIDLVDVRFERTDRGAPETYAVTGFFIAETNPDFGPGGSPFLFELPSDFAVNGLARSYTPATATGLQLFTPPQPDPPASGLGALQLDPEMIDPGTGFPFVDDVTLELLFDVSVADTLFGAGPGDVVTLPLASGKEQGTRFEPTTEDSFQLDVGQSIPGRDDVVTATVLGADIPVIPLPAGGWLLLAGLLPLARMAARRSG